MRRLEAGSLSQRYGPGVGGKGYPNDDPDSRRSYAALGAGATGMQLLGAQYYLPLLGRFLTQDPIGHEGGLNLDAYCGNSPLLKVDPDGTQDMGFGLGISGVKISFPDGIWGFGPQNGSWRAARRTTELFIAGYGPTMYSYKGLNNPRVLDVATSQIGVSIRSAIAGTSEYELRHKGTGGSIGTWLALRNTLIDFENGTQAQLGAVQWQARLEGETLRIWVYNKIGLNSYYFHATAPLGIPDRKRTAPGQRYTDVKQFFYWEQAYRRR